MRLIRYVFIALFSLLVLSAGTFEARAADFKIAVINDQKLLSDSKAAKSITRQIDAQRESFQKQFSQLEQQLRTKEKSLLTSKDKLKPEEFNKQRAAFQSEVAEGQKKAQQSRGEMEQAIILARTTLMTKIAEVSKSIAEKNGYNIVLTRQNVVLADKDLDITDQVLAQLDKALTEVPMNFGKK